jgi:hypothetical protein
MAEDKSTSKKIVEEQKARIQAEKEFGQSLSYAQTALMEQVKALKEQQGLVQGLVRSSKMLNDSTKQNVELKNDLSALYSSELQVANDVVLKRAMVKTQLQGEYAQYLAQYMIQKGIKSVTDPRLSNLVKELKHRQELSNHLEEERDLYETIAAKTLEIREEADSYKKSLMGVLATARAIGNDPKTMGALMLTEGIKKAGKFAESFEHMKEQGLNAGQAIQAQFKGMDLMSIMGLSDVKGVTSAMISEFGNVNALSSQTTSQLGKMAVHMGITGEEAGKLAANMSTIPGETAESAANAMEHTGHLAEMQGIAPGKIMKDMAANTGEMARAGAKGAEEFGKSVVELHKMGVELQTASKIADGLLDFESSINAQNEASVLLGREINLDKAREMALNNDIAGMSKEILKNVGSSAEFGKMNRLEQDALAKSVGMTVEELTKSLDAQEESNKYFGEGASIGMNALGYLTEYGSKAAGFFKENGLLILSSLQFMSQFGLLQKLSNGLTAAGNFLMSNRYVAEIAHWAKQKAQWVAEKAHEMWKAGAAKLGFASKAKDVAGGAADKLAGAGAAAKKVPKDAGKSTGGLTKSIEKINPGKLLAGAAALVLVAAAVFIFAKAAQEFKNVELPAVLMAVGAMFALVGALSLVGSIMSGPVGLFILAGAAAMLIMAAAVYVLGKAIQEMATGFDMFVPALLQLAPMAAQLAQIAASLVVMGGGVLALGMASYIAFPGLMLTSLALSTMMPSLYLINEIAQQGGLTTMAEGLMQMALAGPGLGLVAISLGGMAIGLASVAAAGLAALPIFAALTAFAAVGPALGALGGMFGGGGGEKDDKMDELIGEIRELKAIMSQGGVVNMDGKKVGDVLRLAISTSGVR